MKLLFIMPNMGTDGIHVGSYVIFKKILSRFSSGEIVLFSISQYKNQTSDWMKNYKHYFSNSILFYPYIVKLFKKTFLRKLFFIFEWEIYPYIAIKKIIKIIKKENINKIWVYGCAETVPIIKKLYKSHTISYHISIHDDMIENPYFKNKYSEKLADDVLYVLKNAKSCDLVSPYMKEYYYNKYKICKDAFNIWAGFIDLRGKVKRPIIRKKIRKIAFVGSIGSIEEHQTLWKAIKLLNINRNKRDHLSISYYTHEFNKRKLIINNEHVRFIGLKPQNELLLELMQYDLLYVTMPLNKKWKIVCDVSFPSKTMLYIETGVPILVHAPIYSTISKFIIKYNAGLLLTSNNYTEMAKQIEGFEKKYNLRKKISLKNAELASKDFNLDNSISDLIHYIKN